MKKIIYIAFAAAALAAVSCAKVGEFTNTPAQLEQGLTLRFTCGDMATRATVDGVVNENRVDRIDFFIFPIGSDGTVADTTVYVYSDYIVPEDSLSRYKGTYEKVIEPGILSQIFPNGIDSAVVFAVANYVDKYGAPGDSLGTSTAIETPNKILPDSVKTWKGLHELEVGPTFFKDGGAIDEKNQFLLRWPRVMQPKDKVLFFVMTGEETIKLQTSGEYAVDAEIPLRRLASKVTVNFTYEDYLEKKKKISTGDVYEIINWVPQNEAGETRVFLSNGIEHTTLGGPLSRNYVADSWGTATKPLGNGTRDLFEYAYDFMNTIPVVEGKKTAHYYTYPIDMEEGDDNQPYLKLVLPWYGYKYVGTETNPTYSATDPNWIFYKQKEVYYKIVLPRETLKDPNCIYEYSVNVNIIGSDREVKIIGEEYVVKDWTHNDPVNSSVATGRYISLDIPKEEFDMYVDKIDIAFVSSGSVTPIVEEIYQWNYSGTTPTKDYFMQNNTVTTNTTLLNSKGVTAENVRGWVTIPAGTSYLRINHAMCNDITVNPISKFDAAPYVYRVRLHLDAAGESVTAYDRWITITQYPAMYIEAETNSAYSEGDDYGYVYIHGQQRVPGQWDYQYWYDVSGLGGNNSNPNMFVITSTILSDANMILADPRKMTVQNGYSSNDGSWSASAQNMYTGNTNTTKLTYYYPTDNTSTAKQKVSPKFRIASSYGKTIPVDRDEAWQRCASYQEDGYPAGRWRVPTTAEVKYVVNLSANGFMDVLFGNPRTENESTNYWTSTGYVTVNNYPTVTEKVQDHDGSPGGNVNVYVRCVYDEWYWSDKAPDKTQFIWGDKER